jgi:hypothetical protein
MKSGTSLNLLPEIVELFHIVDAIFLFICKGDVESGDGIVAGGIATGKLKKRTNNGNPEHAEEFSISLSRFEHVEKSISAAEIKDASRVKFRLMNTLFSIESEPAKKLVAVRLKRKCK